MEARLDFWIIVFMAAAAQGLFLCAMLLFKKGPQEKVRQNLLALLVLSFTITLAYYTTFWTGVNPTLPRALRVFLELPFLFGPLAYLYLRHLVFDKVPKYTILHFVPFLFFAIISFFPYPGIGRLAFYPLPGFFMTLHLVTYGSLAIYLVKAGNGNKWVRNVALSFNGYVLCFFTYYVLVWLNLMQTQYDYMVSLGSTIFIYFIGYHGFKNPVPVFERRPEDKYQKSSLTDEALKHIVQRMDELMASKKLYTDGDLKLTDLAQEMELTPHALSQAINVAKSKKFTDYLNELRVQEAISLMHKSEYEDVKLLAVAIDSGFNNKTSFLNAFKKYKGVSPSEYRKSILSKAS